MTIDAEFVAFPKIPRLNRGMIVSEKIDGTNAQVWVEALPESANDNVPWFATVVEHDSARYLVGAGLVMLTGRKRYRVGSFGTIVLQVEEACHGGDRWRDAKLEDISETGVAADVRLPPPPITYLDTLG